MQEPGKGLTCDERVHLSDFFQRLQNPWKTVSEPVDTISDRLHHIALPCRLCQLPDTLPDVTLPLYSIADVG